MSNKLVKELESRYARYTEAEDPSAITDPSTHTLVMRVLERELRRYTPQELMLAYQAAARAIPPWPPSPAAIPLHWRHRLLTLQTANYRYGTPADHDACTHAAIYSDAIALTAAALNPRQASTIKQDPLANSPGPPRSHQP